jgi:hypothetical protein
VHDKSFPIHSRLCEDDEFLTKSKVTTQSGIADEISRKVICLPYHYSQLIWCIKPHGLGVRVVDFQPEGCVFSSYVHLLLLFVIVYMFDDAY